MKILLTGSNGILGKYLLDSFVSNGWDVDPYKRILNQNVNSTINATINDNLDYDVIVHAAANTDVEACEKNPLQSFEDNTFLTERLAIAAQENNCKFVYISSTGIYGAQKLGAPYHEYDEVVPTTIHHESKWQGEKAVRTFVNDHLILRVGWLFGGKPEQRKNFVARRIEEALASSVVESNETQRGVPTSARQVSERICELIKRNEIGTYNIVNSGHCSRYEYVKEILRIADISTEVVPIKSSCFKRVAKVSNNETAVTFKMNLLGYQALDDWEQSLKKYINSELRDWLKCQKSKTSQF